MNDETEPTRAANEITGVVLAGGQARRMGGLDKGLLELGGRPLVCHIVEALRPQVQALLINANRNLEEYRRLTDLPVIPDRLGGFAGPLAGMASAMEVAETPYLLTVPCDSPWVCPDLAARLHSAASAQQVEIAVAADQHRMQPVFALLRCELLESLVAYLNEGGRKIDRWYERHPMVQVEFSDHPQMFLNINTPQEQEALAAQLAASR